MAIQPNEFEPNEFERFIEDNFAAIPAVSQSRTREYLSNLYGTMMIHAQNCAIDDALSSFSRFCSLANQMQGETVSHWNAGLITNVEMMNIITKFSDFIDKAVPEYLTQVLTEKCKCVYP